MNRTIVGVPLGHLGSLVFRVISVAVKLLVCDL